MRVLLILSLLISSAFSREFDLASEKTINIGYIGSSVDKKSLDENGEITLRFYGNFFGKQRKYKLKYEADVLENHCVDYVNDYSGAFLYGYPHFMYLGRGYYSSSIGLRGYYVNSAKRCVQWKEVLVRREETLKIVFDKEFLSTIFLATPYVKIVFMKGARNTVSYGVITPASVAVKKFNKRVLKLSVSK